MGQMTTDRVLGLHFLSNFWAGYEKPWFGTKISKALSACFRRGPDLSRVDSNGLWPQVHARWSTPWDVTRARTSFWQIVTLCLNTVRKFLAEVDSCDGFAEGWPRNSSVSALYRPLCTTTRRVGNNLAYACMYK
jgi:hypothetical protein